MNTDRRRAISALTAAGLLWGTTVPLSKLALGWLAPGWLTFVRFGLAAAILLAVAPRARVRAACTPSVLASGAIGYGGSVVVQVQLRRGDTLFVNDGVYGSLSDAGALGFRFPARRIRLGEIDNAEEASTDFALFGPTCDSADRMRGPFRLPADMREGDWIELGQLGAYGACLRTAFNGFGRVDLVEVADPPMLATPGYEEA